MTLSSMVVSRDWQEASVLERILGALHMDVAVEREPQQALARFTKEKIDALIVDCDLEGSAQLLHQLRRAERRAPAAPLVILRGPRSHNLRQSAALCTLEKPVSVEEAVHALSAARNLILDGRLRYHRAGLDVPVWLNCRSHKRAEAHLVNLSQGGMRIHTDDPVEATKPLRVSFVLPGARPALRAQAEIAWRDQCGNLGIRFVKIAPRQQRMLQQWLARQYFAN